MCISTTLSEGSIEVGVVNNVQFYCEELDESRKWLKSSMSRGNDDVYNDNSGHQ